ncbi:hypothetical protein I79_011531 [Cricetulus griseus]|uniref:Uncharacterized protein n=1 Tax=Cricetulus griseus TaxID=10029 RepID=G3HLE2_CRIGR|nr:hypothetical protein I79_011531 [Cricetulus griseus]
MTMALPLDTPRHRSLGPGTIADVMVSLWSRKVLNATTLGREVEHGNRTCHQLLLLLGSVTHQSHKETVTRLPSLISLTQGLPITLCGCFRAYKAHQGPWMSLSSIPVGSRNTAAESAHLHPQVGGREPTGSDTSLLNPQSPHPMTPPTRPHVLVLPKHFFYQGPSIQR